jgi:hypothetical protein
MRAQSITRSTLPLQRNKSKKEKCGETFHLRVEFEITILLPKLLILQWYQLFSRTAKRSQKLSDIKCCQVSIQSQGLFQPIYEYLKYITHGILISRHNLPVKQNMTKAKHCLKQLDWKNEVERRNETKKYINTLKKTDRTNPRHC